MNKDVDKRKKIKPTREANRKIGAGCEIRRDLIKYSRPVGESNYLETGLGSESFL